MEFLKGFLQKEDGSYYGIIPRNEITTFLLTVSKVNFKRLDVKEWRHEDGIKCDIFGVTVVL